jgi:hypothetical protein
MRIQLEQDGRSSEFVGSGVGVIASIKECLRTRIPRIRLCSVGIDRIKIRFNLGESLHKIEVQAEGVGCLLEQIAGRSRRHRVWLAGAATCVRLAADIGWRGGLARNE